MADLREHPARAWQVRCLVASGVLTAIAMAVWIGRRLMGAGEWVDTFGWLGLYLAATMMGFARYWQGYRRGLADSEWNPEAAGEAMDIARERCQRLIEARRRD